jgi:queuosine precursor transporter
VIPFPITFLLTDIVNEYYGKEGARFLTLVGLAMMLFANAMLMLGGLLPTASNSWVSDQSYQNVFGLSWRLFLGSLCAYVLGQVSDIYSFQAMKRITGSRMLWLRATGSTFFSQIIDTVVVNFAIFAGMKTWDQLGQLIFWSYVYKMVVAVGLTPLLYVAHAIIKRWLGITGEPVAPAPKPA